MKTTQNLLAALLLGSVSIIHAATPAATSTNYVTNTVIYIAGSQAFSALDNAALSDYAANNGYTLVASTGSTNAIKAKALLFRKENAPVMKAGKASVSVDIINVHQTGSEAGVRSAAGDGNQKVAFLPNNATGLALADADASYTNTNQAVITTSPVWQPNSLYKAGAKQGSVKFKALTEISIGSEPGIAAQIWAWSVSTNFPTNALNITDSTAQALFSQGHVPLSYFTGNPSDTNQGVWLIGRDVAAGARNAALTIAGYGSVNTVRQYHVNVSNNVASLQIEQPASVNGVQQVLGNGGYNGTTTQLNAAKTLLPSDLLVDLGNGYTNSPYSAGNYLIQYNGYALSVGQTNSNGNPSVLPLSHNGVYPSTNAVIAGAYGFWTYEHLYVAPKPKNTNTLAVATYVGRYIANLSSAGIKSLVGQSGYLATRDLQVYRTMDGGKIYRK